MIWTIAVILALLWLLGLATGFLLGGYIHALVIVVVVLLIVGAFRAGTKIQRRGTVTRSKLPVPDGKEFRDTSKGGDQTP